MSENSNDQNSESASQLAAKANQPVAANENLSSLDNGPKVTSDMPPQSKLLLEMLPEHPRARIMLEHNSQESVCRGFSKTYVPTMETIGNHVMIHLMHKAPRKIRLLFHKLDWLANYTDSSAGVYTRLATLLDSGATVDETVEYATNYCEGSSPETLAAWDRYKTEIRSRWAVSGKSWPPRR